MNPRRNKILKKETSPLQFIAYAVAAVVFVLLLLAAYHTIRRTAARMSADFYYPFLKTVRGLENTYADGTLLVQNNKTLAAALIKLQKENFELTSGHAIVQDLQKENEELRRTLRLRRKHIFTPVFAEVLTRDPMTWNEQFVIDRGSDAGISEGDPVVVSSVIKNMSVPTAALIGRIKSVSRHTAVVSTVLSQDFKLSGTLSNSRASGILEGESNAGTEFSRMRYIPVKTVLKDGELALTNSFSGNNPPGIPVGEVVAWDSEHVGREQDHVYLEARIRPFVQPDSVRFVAVYVKEKQ